MKNKSFFDKTTDTLQLLTTFEKDILSVMSTKKNIQKIISLSESGNKKASGLLKNLQNPNGLRARFKRDEICIFEKIDLNNSFTLEEGILNWSEFSIKNLPMGDTFLKFSCQVTIAGDPEDARKDTRNRLCAYHLLKSAKHPDFNTKFFDTHIIPWLKTNKYKLTLIPKKNRYDRSYSMDKMNEYDFIALNTTNTFKITYLYKIESL